MLRHDGREECLFERIAFPLQRAEAIAPDVQILRCKGNESLFGELCREGRIVLLALLADCVLWATFEAVLAYDDRTTLALAEIVGNQQQPVCEDRVEHVEHNLVRLPAVRMQEWSRVWSW